MKILVIPDIFLKRKRENFNKKVTHKK